MQEDQVHRKVNITGIEVSSISMADLFLVLNHRMKHSIKTRICVTPVNCLTAANKNAQLKTIYNSADFVLCDGVPVVWASKLLGTPIKQRITGLDFLPMYIEECAQKGYSMFFLGAKEGVGVELARLMQEKYPTLKMVGVYSPPFAEKFSDEENNHMVALVNAAKPDLLWVSLTAPKQDFWIAEHFDQLEVKIAVGVGGAFEVSAGLIDRAPVFYQKNGLEWFYRFIKEPKRLFRRYFVEAPVIIPLLIKQRFKKK
jgi:N-acetylglucosaminyldiphosphoundecaprenol N-acetyl-beta-D-mannosaminyltransferase